MEAFKIALSLKGKTDLIAIYGGDGSISEVARALLLSDTPLAIIPGGTANVLAKELGIPQDTEVAIQLLINDQTKIDDIDMGMANDCPFLIRVNFGIMAVMILHTDREMKKSLGQLAYGITTLQTIGEAKHSKYKLKVDGTFFTGDFVALTVTNVGNIGYKNFSLLPNINVYDGLLDLIILKDANFMSMLELAGTTLFQTDSDILKHILCKEISIDMILPTEYICDDIKQIATHLHIKMLPKALKVLVPLTN